MSLKKFIAAFLGTAAMLAATTVIAETPQWRIADTVYETKELITVGFNVIEFGAAGDGVTDDTQAFQLAIDAAADAGGASVFIPVGRYAIKGNLMLKQVVILQGDNEEVGPDRKNRGDCSYGVRRKEQ